MSERINKTSICSVVFLDIVDYSKMSVSEQSDLKDQFNALINEAIKNVAQNDRIILDTGDGAAISLLGAPEEALFVSMTIRDGILEHNKIDSNQPLLVRIGINLGPVRVVSDINGQPNIIGDGINVAQRVMSFAEPNQILVSRSYYEVTSRLTKEITGMFAYSGIKHDKHVREHEVYVIRSTGELADVSEATSPVESKATLAATADTKPMSKQSWVMLAVILLGLVAAAVYWSSKMRTSEPAIETPGLLSAETPSSSALPVTSQPAIEPLATQPAPAVVPDTKKTAKKKQTKPKKSSTVESSKGTNTVNTASQHTSTNAGGSDVNRATATKAESAASVSQEKPEEASKWDSFKDSVKHGGKKECAQGEIALHQCK